MSNSDVEDASDPHLCMDSDQGGNDHDVDVNYFFNLLGLKFYIKSHVRLYKIPSLILMIVFFLTSIHFIRYKVTVMVLICFVFPS